LAPPLLWAVAGEAPAASTAAATASELPETGALIEMRRRRVLPPGQARPTPENDALLLRVREAQAMGAFDVLNARFGTLKGFSVEHVDSNGSRDLWLTLPGYEMFLFVKSQNARVYFEGRGSEVKRVFGLRNLAGALLFDGGGKLTQAGHELYNRIQRRLPAYWRDADGRINGNIRPPRDGSLPAVAPAPAPAARSVEDAEALQRIAALTRTGYVEIRESEERYLLEVTRRTEEQLRRESSLQVVRTSDKTYYLLSPSDPLMTTLARYRTGDRTISHVR